MLNFSNLNDVEFEYLCKDVMSKMLGKKLQRFGVGRDGGIDLTDDAYTKSIIVQVKYYIKTDVKGLLSSLKKEIKKVEKNNPNQYYVCCSKELSPKNKSDIYDMFSDYMETTANIITLTEISDYLDEPDNADILHKHFKLWIESTNILKDIFTNDICIDSETLLCDIEELVHIFVKTTAYDCAISCLNSNNVLMIIGNPGVGKTITSKMLVLHFATLGFKVRYTTDGADLASLKKALSQSPSVKEVILLDDCFGQAYFNMKETQENELLSLIKYVKMKPNKMLIMNSRVTIYQEATIRTPNLINSIDKKEYKVYVLDLTGITVIEKAKIFYNHLFFSELPQLYCEDIKKDKKYIKIVKHDNYNPRIIEFVTNKRQYETFDSSKYSEFIFQCLNNPEQIWKNEYERRLNKTDRILLNTLYSITNTIVSIDVVKKCYMHRISNIQGVDSSINYFEQSLNRLNNSMIKIVDANNKQMLSVVNPSVNDFLAAHLENNIPEKREILSTSICILQLKRLLNVKEYKLKLRHIFDDKSILNFVFDSEKEKIGFITYYCVNNKILDENYETYLKSFIINPHNVDIFEERKIPINIVCKKLFDGDICAFYGLDKIVGNMSNLTNILSKFNLNNAIEFINSIDYLFENECREKYIATTIDILKELIALFCSNVQAEEYAVDIGSVVSTYLCEDDQEIDLAVSEVECIVKDMVLEEIYIYLSELPEDIIIDPNYFSELSIGVSGSLSLINDYLCDDYEDLYYEEYRDIRFHDSEIEYIFER